MMTSMAKPDVKQARQWEAAHCTVADAPCDISLINPTPASTATAPARPEVSSTVKLTPLNLTYSDFYSVGAVWEAIVKPLSMQLVKLKRCHAYRGYAGPWELHCHPTPAFSLKPQADNVLWEHQTLVVRVPHDWTDEEMDEFETVMVDQLVRAFGGMAKVKKSASKHASSSLVLVSDAITICF